MNRILFAALAAAGISTSAYAQDAPRITDISTSGRADIRVAPSRAIVSFIVENFSRNAAAAASENARVSQAIIASLRNAGVKEADLTNGGYSLNQDFEKGDRGKPRGFYARILIRAEVGQISDVGKTIDAALQAGATSVSPIQFSAGDISSIRRDAVKAAALQARLDAETLAEAAGGSLGRLLSMSSSNYGSAISTRGGEITLTTASVAAYVPTDIRPGDITVGAIANGRWEFIPRK